MGTCLNRFADISCLPMSKKLNENMWNEALMKIILASMNYAKCKGERVCHFK